MTDHMKPLGKSRESTTTLTDLPAFGICGWIHATFASGEISCVGLVAGYLDRIDAYDDQGPELNAILTVNPRALEVAAALDARYAADADGVGPLHCIPVIVKDNFD
ncbi:MAG: amidase family protein, partial [Acidobacteriota bacterium]